MRNVSDSCRRSVRSGDTKTKSQTWTRIPTSFRRKQRMWIAAQPFDEKSEKEDKDNEPAVQYHARICVEDLVELGFLKKKEGENR